jgi:zinc transporter ZupT
MRSAAKLLQDGCSWAAYGHEHPSDWRNVLVHSSREDTELVVKSLPRFLKDSNEQLKNTAAEKQQAVITCLEDVLHSIHAGIDSLPAITAAKWRARS